MPCNGGCITLCVCTCYTDDDFGNPEAELPCICGHRTHTTFLGGERGHEEKYCQTACPDHCQLVECLQYETCGTKLPAWDLLNNDNLCGTCGQFECEQYKHCGETRGRLYLEIHGGMCLTCASIKYEGKITFTDVKEECPVCYEEKYMLRLACNHAICYKCLITMYERNECSRVSTPAEERTKCPLCRNTISA
jgi:hypothetical protein